MAEPGARAPLDPMAGSCSVILRRHRIRLGGQSPKRGAGYSSDSACRSVPPGAEANVAVSIGAIHRAVPPARSL